MNLRKKIFIVSLIMFILMSLTFVSASENETALTDDASDVLTVDENVEVETQVNDEDTLSEEYEKGTFGYLNEKFNGADKFEFDMNYTAQSGDSQINIFNTITIDGKGYTIDAKGHTGIFQTDNDRSNYIHVTIKNLIFKNANSNKNGGAILVESEARNIHYTLINCTFESNTADCKGGAIYFDPDEKNGELEIINCTFIKNSVWADNTWKDDDGGAIWVGDDSKLSIVGSNFERNKAKHYGGAIYSKAKEFTIVNCTFDHNEAFNKYGGAIYVDKNLKKIENTDFTGNFGRSGGAIYINNNDNKLDITSCNFKNNNAQGPYSNAMGGAIYNVGSELYVSDSNFTANHAGSLDDDEQTSKPFRGGAIYTTKEIYVDGSRFQDNFAYDDGGAIYANDGIQMGYDPCYFLGNYVYDSNPTYANKGGAIYTTKFINDCKGAVFIWNRAQYGGAIYINNKVDMTFDTCYFTDNRAMHKDGKTGCGGAIYVDSSSSKISLINNVFSNNQAHEGQDVYNCGYYQTVKNNWWATNNPDFSQDRLIEWHKIGSNSKISDSDPLKIVFETMDRDNPPKFYDATLILKFVDGAGYPAGKIINWNATFKANKAANFTFHKLGDNNATIVFTPTDSGDYEITAKVILFEIKLNIRVQGDFGTLQELINDTESGTTLNLTRDYTYGIGADTIRDGIVIDKPLTINGNGFTIDSKGQSSIFQILSDNVVINNLTLIGGSHEGEPYDDDGNPTIYTNNVIEIKNANNTLISNCIITNATDCAVTSEGGNNTIVDNCTFTHNSGTWSGALNLTTPNTLVNNSRFYFNYGQDGGAIYTTATSLRILNCEFLNNTASSRGGAIRGSGENAIIDYCIFEYNNAQASYGGAAINWEGENATIRNSKFLNNKAVYPTLTQNAENPLIFTLTGENNYINAIHTDKTIKFENVTYWNGTVVTGNDPVKTENITGIYVTIDIYKNGTLVKKAEVMTNASGQAKYDYYELEDGTYTYKAYHADDNYYGVTLSVKEIEGSFTLERQASLDPVTINITNGKEFEFDNCTITFIGDYDSVRVVITNASSGAILIDGYTDNKNYTVGLFAGTYNITVYSSGDSQHYPSKDSKLFIIKKIAAHIEVDPISDNLQFGDNINVTFKGSTNSYRVEVERHGNNIFNQTTSNHYMVLPTLGAGDYNLLIYDLGDGGRVGVYVNKTFTIHKKENNVKIDVEDVDHGQNVTITVRADGDGEYMLIVTNSTEGTVKEVTLNVVNGTGNVTLSSLSIGKYSVKVTSDMDNYDTKPANATFNVFGVKSNVAIVNDLENVLVGENVTIYLSDDHPTTYNITLKNFNTNVTIENKIINGTSYQLPKLDKGTYLLNVVNMGNEDIERSSDTVIFNVTNENYVEVYAEDTELGRETVIYIYADVDGTYHININGTEFDIEVVDGFGGYKDILNYTGGEDFLNPGIYSVNVTFDDKYDNIIENTTFEIYPGQSNIHILEPKGNVTYGNVTLTFYDLYIIDDYDIVIYDQNEDIVYENSTTEFSVKLELGPGIYTVYVINQGDDEVVIGSEDSATFKVIAQSKVQIEPMNNVSYGEDITLKFRDEFATEFHITIKDSEGNVIKELTTKENSSKLSNLEVGEYTAVVINPGNEYILASNDTIKFNITRAEEYLFDVDVVGSTVIVTLPNQATGNITLNISGKTFNQTLKEGQAIFNLENMTYGNYTASVSYTGDKNYAAKSMNQTITVEKLTIVASDASYGWSKTVDYQVKLIDDKGNAESGVVITFTVNGKTYNVTTDANGTAKVTLSLNVGKYDITATTINGDVAVKKITIVNRLIQNANVNMYYFDGTSYKVKAIGDNGKAVGAGQIVVIKFNKKTYKVKTDKNGIAKLKIPKTAKVGKYTITATYKGKTVKNTVKVKQNLKLKKVKVKRSAKKLVLKATLKNGKKAVKGKKVTFKFKGKKYTAKTSKKGVAKVTIKKKVLKKLKKGKKVKYQVTYLKNTVKRTAKVKR